MKKATCLILLFCCCLMPLRAQSDKKDIPWSTNESTMLGFGGYNIHDSYLSPSANMNYTGWVARVMNERLKMVKLVDYRIARQQIINVEFGSTHNGAETAHEYAGFVDYSLGYLYRFDNVFTEGLRFLTGASARAQAGFIYNTRNSNNPASGKADLDLNISAMAIYGFKIKNYPVTVRYQGEMPFMGVLFSIHRGEPYYFLSQGDTDGIVRFSSFNNKFAVRNYITMDLPLGSFTVRLGYLNSIYRTDVNGIKTHVISNTAMIGLVKEFVSFGGKRLKDTQRYSSAYY